MSSDFETHERGTAEELRILRGLAEMVGAMLGNDPKFSLRDLRSDYDLLLKHYKQQPDYLSKREL